MSGRIRTIKPELLEDAVSAGLSDTAFRLFIAMILLADDYGNFRAETAFLNGQVYWKAAPAIPLDVAVAELSSLIVFYESRGQRYGHIRSWKKHQKVSHPGKPRVPRPSEILESDSGDPPEDSGESRETLVPDLRSRPPTSDPERERDARGGAETLAPPEGEAPQQPRESGVTRTALRAVESSPSSDVASGAPRDDFDDPTKPSAGQARASAIVATPRRLVARLEGAGVPCLLPNDLEPTQETVDACLMSGYPDPRPLMVMFRAHHRSEATESASWQDKIILWASRQNSFAPRSTGTHGTRSDPHPGPVNPSRRPPPKE